MDISLASLVLVLLAFVLPLLYLLLLLPLPGKRSGDGGDGLKSPPSPAGCLPLLGHLHLLGALPHRALRSLAVAHGPVLRLRLGRVPTVLVSSAAAAEEVLRARDVAFSSRPRSAMAERLLYGRDVAFAPYGEHWRQARLVCVVHLLSAQRVCSFRRVREEEAAALADAVRATGGHAFDLSGLLVAHANAVVSRAAFGDESARGLYGGADGGRALRKVFSDFSQLLGTKPVRDLLPWLGWVDTLRGLERKVRRTFEALDGVLDKVIDDHRRRRRESGRQTCDAAGQRDFVDVLLDVNEMDNEAGIQLDPIEIKAIIMDMFVAGSDATSTPMEWAMAELVSHPRHMRRLQDEIRAVVGDAGGRVTEDHIDKLPYLRAVLKETLRLHAPLPLLVPRETVADTEIMGYHVAARTRVVINGWAIGRDTAVWGEAAEEFMPERFLAGGGGGRAADYKGQGFEMLPFGSGRRGCPGVTFGMATVEMAVASLLYHFDWAAAAANGKGCREEGMSSLDMSETSGISLGIKHGLPLVAKPRFP